MKRSPKTHLLHRSLEECQREARQRALTAKMMPTKAAINTSLLPFSVSENRVMGFPVIYRFYRLLQRLKVSPTKKEKVKSKGDHWLPSPWMLWCGWSSCHVRGAKEANSQHWFVSAPGYTTALCLLLCSCKQGDGAPWERRSTSGRDALGHSGESMTARATKKREDCWEEQATEMLEILIFQQPRKLQPVDWKNPTCKTHGIEWSLIYSPIWFWVHLVCLYH